MKRKVTINGNVYELVHYHFGVTVHTGEIYMFVKSIGEVEEQDGRYYVYMDKYVVGTVSKELAGVIKRLMDDYGE